MKKPKPPREMMVLARYKDAALCIVSAPGKALRVGHIVGLCSRVGLDVDMKFIPPVARRARKGRKERAK